MSTSSNRPQQSASSATGEKSSQETATANERLSQAGQHFVAEPACDILEVLKDYAHDKPDVAALWCLGLGLIVGWKLRG